MELESDDLSRFASGSPRPFSIYSMALFFFYSRESRERDFALSRKISDLVSGCIVSLDIIQMDIIDLQL